jgi:tetratricopeptide (TPR) repeat protein
MLWYQFQPFRAYFQVGRYQEVLALADATLATTPDVEELHYWRARALFMLGARDDAIKAARKAILLNPNYTQAQAFLSKLENSE